MVKMKGARERQDLTHFSCTLAHVDAGSIKIYMRARKARHSVSSTGGSSRKN
jgi:hypothetical protein